MDTKNDTISLREKVYRAIFEDIISGRYTPEDIISENDLIEKYSVSKSPIRDALIELCKDNILVSMPRVGYRLSFHSNDWFDSVRDFRLCIEPHYLEKNWDLLTKEAIDHLEKTQSALISRGDKIVADVVDHWLRNQQFHLTIAQIWQDKYFYEMLEITLKRQTIAYAQFYWNQWKQSTIALDVDLHRKIIEAMRRNDRIGAKEYLIQDIAHFTSPYEVNVPLVQPPK